MTRIKIFDADHDRAVSPVIGVILMVAITVILAAVIGAFVLGLGEDISESQAPTVSTSASTNSDYPGASGTAEDVFYISHSTGDTIEHDDLRVVVRDEDGAGLITFDSGDNGWSGTVNGQTVDLQIGNSAPAADNSFEPGSTIRIIDQSGDSAFSTDEDYTLQVIHRSSGSVVGENTVSL